MGNHHSTSPSSSDRKHAKIHRQHSKIESACLEIIREEVLRRLQDDYGPWDKKVASRNISIWLRVRPASYHTHTSPFVQSEAPPPDVQTQLEQEFKKNIRHYVVVIVIVFPYAHTGVMLLAIAGCLNTPTSKLKYRKNRTRKFAILTKNFVKRRVPCDRLTGKHLFYLPKLYAS